MEDFSDNLHVSFCVQYMLIFLHVSLQVFDSLLIFIDFSFDLLDCLNFGLEFLNHSIGFVIGPFFKVSFFEETFKVLTSSKHFLKLKFDFIQHLSVFSLSCNHLLNYNILLVFILFDIFIKRLSVFEERLLDFLLGIYLFGYSYFIHDSFDKSFSLVQSIDHKTCPLLIKDLFVQFDTETFFAIDGHLKSIGVKIDLEIGIQF